MYASHTMEIKAQKVCCKICFKRVRWNQQGVVQFHAALRTTLCSWPSWTWILSRTVPVTPTTAAFGMSRSQRQRQHCTCIPVGALFTSLSVTVCSALAEGTAYGTWFRLSRMQPTLSPCIASTQHWKVTTLTRNAWHGSSTYRKLPDLVECLYKVVATQMADLRRALHSQGNFKVSSTFGKFIVTNSVWQSMSAEDKETHVEKFLAYRPRQATTSTTVMSANGVLTLPVTSRIAT